jgi:hypothetical protein
MVAAAKAPEVSSPDVEDPDVSALVIQDDAPRDNIFAEKQERLLTEPLYSSWSGPPPVSMVDTPRPRATPSGHETRTDLLSTIWKECHSCVWRGCR